MLGKFKGTLWAGRLLELPKSGGGGLGVSLHPGFDGFRGSGEHIALLVLVTQNAGQRCNCQKTITRVSCNPTFVQKKKRALSGGLLLLFLCFRAEKGPKNLHQTLVASDTRVSLVKVLPKT